MHVITGGIGCGKSTILRQFARLGRHTADADEIAHSLYAPGSEVMRRIRELFGDGVINPDGTLARPILAAAVFGSPDRLRQLEAITHPAIISRLKQLDDAAGGGLVAAIPLWYEGGLAGHFPRPAPRVIAVWCDDATQWRRLRERGWSDDHITLRLASQFTKEEKLRRADYGVVNNGTIDELFAQCRRINDELA